MTQFVSQSNRAWSAFNAALPYAATCVNGMVGSIIGLLKYELGMISLLCLPREPIHSVVVGTDHRWRHWLVAHPLKLSTSNKPLR